MFVPKFIYIKWDEKDVDQMRKDLDVILAKQKLIKKDEEKRTQKKPIEKAKNHQHPTAVMFLNHAQRMHQKL